MVDVSELLAKRIGQQTLGATLDTRNIFVHLTNILLGLARVHGFEVILRLAGIRLELSRGIRN